MRFRRNQQQLSTRQLLENRFRSGRQTLLIVILFTVINIGLAFFGGDVYFLFSATIPYVFVLNALYLCGKMPDDWYDGPKDQYVFEDISTLIVAVVIAVVVIGLFLLCYLMSKKHVGWLIASAVLFAVDFIAMFFLLEIGSDTFIDIAFHAIVLGYLIMGIVSAYKLRNLPPEEPPVIEVPVE